MNFLLVKSEYMNDDRSFLRRLSLAASKVETSDKTFTKYKCYVFCNKIIKSTMRKLKL